MSQAGTKDFLFNSWFAIVAPAGTPKDIGAKLNVEIQKALSDSETRKKIVDLGVTIRGTGAEEFGTATKKQYELYGKLIRDNGIKAD